MSSDTEGAQGRPAGVILDSGEAGSASASADTAASGAPGPAARAKTGALPPWARTMLSRYGLLLAFAVTIVVFGIIEPDSFLTIQNLKSILTSAAPLLIVAAGLTVVLVMADFDLSIGAMIGLGGATAVVLMSKADVAWPLAIVVALLVGVAAGAVNGYLIAYLGGSSFIITLAMTTVLIGVEFLLTDQETIFSGIAQGYADIGQSRPLLDLNTQVYVAAVVSLLIWLLLEKSEIGRYMYAIGGNPEASRLAGVRIREIRLLGFIIVAVCAAIAGILLTSLAASSTPTQGSSYLLPAFAAVFLGSAVFRPGEFNLLGTVVGVLFLGTIQTGLTMADMETAAINIVEGAILITAILVSRLGHRA
jgi:ribose transport system permease protein